MTDEKDSSLLPSQELTGGTRIDLGEDLLQYTAESAGTGSLNLDDLDLSEEVFTNKPGSVLDLLDSAKILINEGLPEDAKKALRQVLIADPGNALGRRLLNDIHDLELKQIFVGEEVRRPFERKPQARLHDVDSDALMRLLDRDLKLGLFSENAAPVRADQLSLFKETEMLDEFVSEVEKGLEGASVQDWTDLGIAFLEMDFYSIAVRLFTSACRRLPPSETVGQQEEALSVTSLLGFALILAGRPYEAISKLQPLLRDPEIKHESKIELFYLMGRTHESMDKWDNAVQFYDQVMEIDPFYRDTDYRLRKRPK